MRTWLALVAAMLFSACAAGSSRGLYESPLRDAGMLSQKARSEWRIETISHEGISNVKPGERPQLSSDEAGLWMLMDGAEARLKTSGLLVRDENLNGYLRTVLCRLTPDHCQDIRIYLVRIPYLNASMAPNGAMQIWTGLLLRTENEAQLASIMGHEIGHYLRRHSLQRMRDLIAKTSPLQFVQLAEAVARLPLGGDIMDAVGLRSVQAFSRDQEREADGYGMALMARAGYDPLETSRMWRKVMEEGRTEGTDRNRSLFLATHPADEERFEALKELGEKVKSGTGAAELGEVPFLDQVLPHRADYLWDEIHLGNFERAERLLALIESAGREGEIHFFRGELFRLRNREGDLKRALAEYREAAQGRGCPPEIHRSLGLVYWKMGDRGKGADAFRAFLQSTPECNDRKMIEHMIEEMDHR